METEVLIVRDDWNSSSTYTLLRVPAVAVKTITDKNTESGTTFHIANAPLEVRAYLPQQQAQNHISQSVRSQLEIFKRQN